MPKSEKWKSIFTGPDFSECYITGRTDHIEIHHVFEGRQGFKDLSEWYNFLCPLHASIHHGVFMERGANWRDLDHYLKRKCQEYYLENYGTREDWYREFGKFYDDRADERCWRNKDLVNNYGK